MALAPPNNALAWAHFRLRGGWVRSLTWTGGAIALMAILMMGSARADPAGSMRTYFGWASGLLVLQALCLVLFIPGRISNTIRADLTTKMIESHRLMPLPPAHAIAGYIVGAAGQPLVFASANFLLGGTAAVAGGADWRNWIFANGILLLFAAFVWVLCAYIAFGAKLGAGMLFFPLMIPYLSEGGVLALLPGMTVMLSPIIGRTVFDLRNVGMTLPGPFAIAIGAQAAVATICFIAAARKYRSSESIGLDTVLGLCLVIVWTGISFAGLRAWEDFRPRGWSPVQLAVEVQVVASLLAGMLVALVPIAANAAERVRFRRHEDLRDPAPLARPWALAGVILVATGTLLLIPFSPVAPNAIDITTDMFARTAVIIVLFLIGLYFLFDWCYAVLGRAGWPMFIWLLLTWGGPIAIDLVRYGLTDSTEAEPIGAAATASPAGALIGVWTAGAVNTTTGIVMQAVIALVPVGLWVAMHVRGRGRLVGA